jgi:ABC-2 type transport system permease protein
MDRWKHIYWLGLKELRSLSRDRVVVVLLIWAFSLSIYIEATGSAPDVNNASIAFVDEDHSTLSRKMRSAFYPPNFQRAVIINASETDAALDRGEFMFVIDIPPHFEADAREGLRPEIQVNIDATAVTQAAVGARFIDNILRAEAARHLQRSEPHAHSAIDLIIRTAFNPNHDPSWFVGIIGIIDTITMLTIILTGAALIREREHGTIEHLLVMPLSAFDIAMSKVWANSLVILTAATLSLTIVVQMILKVPIAGSIPLFLGGSILYLFFATAVGILLGTLSRSMAQFALLFLMLVLTMQLLSGGMTPIENHPPWLDFITWWLPSRHFISASQAILMRGAGADVVWPQFIIITCIGLACFGLSIVWFRRSLTKSL